MSDEFQKARDAAAEEAIYRTVLPWGFDEKERRAFKKGADWGREFTRKETKVHGTLEVIDRPEGDDRDALLAEAKEVISFYANQNNYHWSSERLPCGCCSTPVFPKMEADNEGDKARAFLEKIETKGISDFAKVENLGE